ncbi:TetR family transcriptional regulator [Streptomyces sp. NPDC006645]|uniref:TetR/AcrR family transcriptional regulator n=1 Tax=unclassified Streptomyces TaxID=2593676 RepID=UPI0033BB9768
MAEDHTEGLGLRERKKIATRKALGEAALHLAAERGLDGVLIEDIAAAVGVSPRTFSNYFSNKHEAIVSLVLARAAGLRHAVAGRPDDEPLWDSIAHAAALYIPERDAMSEEWRMSARLIRSSPALETEQFKAYAQIERALTQEIAVRTGTHPQDDLFPALAAGVAVCAIRASLRHWLDTADDGIPYSELLRCVIQQVGMGLPEPEAVKVRIDRPPPSGT